MIMVAARSPAPSAWDTPERKTLMTAHARRQRELEFQRDRILTEADPVSFLMGVMKGRPVAKVDWDDNLLAVETPTIDHQMIAAKELISRIIPTLRSVDVETENTNTMRVVFSSPVPLPNGIQPVELLGDDT